MNPYFILSSIVFIILSFGGGYYMGWQGKKTDYDISAAKAAEDSRVENEKVNKGYVTVSKKIREIPVDGSNCVGPRSGGAVDWLSDNYRQ